MNNFAQILKQAARINIAHANEFNRNRARLLRTEMRKVGKSWNQLTAQELIEINRRVDSNNE